MPLQNDPSIPDEAILYRVLDDSPHWRTDKGVRYRPSKLAFYESRGEVSYFLNSADILPELYRLFPGQEIASVPVSVLRSEEVGFAIERRPDEVPPDFQCDPASHVVAGPPVEMTRLEFERRARVIANHALTAIIQPPPAHTPEL